MAIFSEEQWEQLFLKYHRPLIGYFRAIVPCSEEEAEDLVQETWASVYTKYSNDPGEGGYDPSIAGFYTYVKHGFARYIALRKRRQLGKLKESPLDADVWSEQNLNPPDSEDPGPERILIELEKARNRFFAVLELLKLLFLCGGYPHQQLAFGYSQTIYGRQSNRGIEGNPAKVDLKCGEKTLDTLSRSFFHDYIQESGIDDLHHQKLIKSCLDPLTTRLPSSIEELMRLDRASLEHYKKLHPNRAAQTCLRDYYAEHKKGYTSAIPDWCNKVARKIRSCSNLKQDPESGDETFVGPQQTGECLYRNRCKLRHLPPCIDNGFHSPGNRPQKNNNR